DLRKCIELSAEIGNLEIVEGADPELELGALYELSLEEESPPVVLFRKIKGYPPDYRIVVNTRASRVFDTGQAGLDLVRSYRRGARQQAKPLPPLLVEEGPVLEVVREGEAIDVEAFPAPRWH